MKIEITTSIVDGSFKRNRNLVLKAIRHFEGKDVVLTLARPRKTRTNPQNAFYWGIVLPLVQQGLLDATGELRGVNDIHDKILLPMFAPINEIVNKSTGEILEERITSSVMTTTQFCGYIKDIQKWSAEFLGTDIPDPEEQPMMDFKE